MPRTNAAEAACTGASLHPDCEDAITKRHAADRKPCRDRSGFDFASVRISYLPDAGNRCLPRRHGADTTDWFPSINVIGKFSGTPGYGVTAPVTGAGEVTPSPSRKIVTTRAGRGRVRTACFPNHPR